MKAFNIVGFDDGHVAVDTYVKLSAGGSAQQRRVARRGKLYGSVQERYRRVDRMIFRNGIEHPVYINDRILLMPLGHIGDNANAAVAAQYVDAAEKMVAEIEARAVAFALPPVPQLQVRIAHAENCACWECQMGPVVTAEAE